MIMHYHGWVLDDHTWVIYSCDSEIGARGEKTNFKKAYGYGLKLTYTLFHNNTMIEVYMHNKWDKTNINVLT